MVKQKVVRKRIKKKTESKIDNAIKLAVETGEIAMGYKEVEKALLLKDVKVLIIAKNTPPEKAEYLKYLSEVAGIPLIVYEGSSVALGKVCGRPHTVTALAVLNPGESNILELV